MSTLELTLWLGGVLAGLGVIRLLTVEDVIARLVAVNVMSAGTLLALVGLSVRTVSLDPVPQALALTGIVITAAVTAVGLILARALEQDRADTADAHPEDCATDNATDSETGSTR